MKKLIPKVFWQRLPGLTLMLLSGIATIFVFTNSYELAFGKDIKSVNAITKVTLDGLLDLPSSVPAKGDSATEGGFGSPLTLKLPLSRSRIPLIPAIKQNDAWLARANAGQYIIISPSKNNNIGTTVIYIRKSWRTVSNPEILKVDDNLFLDTSRDWRYMYRVTSVDVYPLDKKYVIEDSPIAKLVVTIIDEKNNTAHIIKADLVTVQDSQQ